MLAFPTGHTVRFLAGTSDPFWVVDSRLGGFLLWTGFLVTLAALLITTAMLVRSSRHRALANVGLMCSAVMIVLLTGEGVVRVYHRAAHGIPLFIPMRVFVDRELGWQGIRSFGNPESRRPKIFVVGDSFTTPGGVGEAQMYYVTLGRILDAEMFAYGGGGYGTLQEYLVLDRYLAAVNPDLVLLQVHSNDFVNNQWELERASYFNNNMAVRPYLIGDAVHYRFPEFLGVPRLFLAAHSRLFYWTTENVERITADLARRGHLHSVEQDIQAHGLGVVSFREAVRTTDRLIALFKQRIGATPLVAFTADSDGIFTAQWRLIFQRQGISFVEDVAKRIGEQEARGMALRLADGAHWNAAGHALCGATLAEWLAEHRYVSARPRREGAGRATQDAG